MKPILNIDKIKEWDEFTIKTEPIKSINLMERASHVFANWFSLKFDSENPKILVVASKGNNGGDGLAVARILEEKAYDVEVLIADIQPKATDNFRINLERLKNKRIKYNFLIKDDNLPSFEKYDIIVDALFGSGLTRPIAGFWSKLILAINDSNSVIFSIDIPSGMYANKPVDGLSIKSDHCLSFETPKLGMMLADNSKIVKNWVSKTIGLDAKFLETFENDNFYIEQQDIRNIIKPRSKFDHKGNYGHALIIGGSKGMIGAPVLASKACIRTGSGLVTALIPDIGYDILQSANPEVMTLSGFGNDFLTAVPNLNRYSAVGIGVGLGKHDLTIEFLEEFLNKIKAPLVIDADALNIISENENLKDKIPEGSILTPHPKEFSRLFGPTKNSFERIKLLRKKSQELKIYIILKGAYSAIATPDGKVYFNSTGNPGMATAGSGDVLTGMLTAFLAQGYSTLDSCITGVYLHGLSGDIASGKNNISPLIAGDIIDNIVEAFSGF